MSSTGVLIRPSPQEEKEQKATPLWIQTWKRLERFLPDLKGELFPPEPERAPEPVPEPAEEVVMVENEEEKDKQAEQEKDEVKVEA